MGNSLEASGRDIVYSISDWGEEQSWRWASNAGGRGHTTTVTSEDVDTWVPGRAVKMFIVSPR